MPERILLWIILLAPLAIVIIGGLWGRWKPLPVATRQREMIWAGVIAAVLTGIFFVIDGYRTQSGVAARIFYQSPQVLWALIPVLGLILFIQSKSLAGLSNGRRWMAFFFRSYGLVLLALALAGLQVVMEKDLLSVIFVLDRSKSVPPDQAKHALEFMNKATASKRADDKVGLVVFGGQASPEILPKEVFVAPDVEHLRSEIKPDTTDIAKALKQARASFDEGSAKRIVLLTDGRETEGEAIEEMRRLKADGENIDFWVIPLERGNAPEVLVEKIVIPAEVKWEHPFDAQVFVNSNVSGPARVRLTTGEYTREQVVELTSGPQHNRIEFKGLKLQTGGMHQIEAIIEPLEKGMDTLAENNHAYGFTNVETESRVLLLTSDPAEVEALTQALKTEKLTLVQYSAGDLPGDPEALRNFDCIVLANRSAASLSPQHMAVIESCVRDQGAGLIMIGGDQSFGAGGYLGTPIEQALPVTMDIKNQRVMPSGALGIVLHTCEFADGNSWGKKIAKAAINVLSPQDYAGLLYWGYPGGNSWCFRPTQVARKQWMFSLIDGCEPSDMPDLDGIVNMMVTSLGGLKGVSLKHCIVITDGDPSIPTSGTIALANKNKVTVSVITISPHSGMDVSQMKDVCTQTGGRYYNADDPKKLPQIFIKEAAVVRKSMIYSDDRGIPVMLSSPGEILREFGQEFPKVNAFVVTSLKERAELHLYTYAGEDKDKVPILARWQYGLGKAMVFTSDATTRWAPQWVSWNSYQKFWANAFHWVCRKRAPTHHSITTRMEGNQARVIVEAIDEKGQYLNFLQLKGAASEPGAGRDDQDATSFSLNFTMTAPGRYEATYPVRKQGAYTIAVTDLTDPAKPNTMVSGLANSYSREFQLSGDGSILFKKFEDLPGPGKRTTKMGDLGKLLQSTEPSPIFDHDLDPVKKPTDLFFPLLIIALCLFPLDVAVRRLHIEPSRVSDWIGSRLLPAIGILRKKKDELASAVTNAADAAIADRRPPSLMPTGEESRAAQSRYEQAGQSAEAQNMDLKPKEDPGKPKAVGGHKVSPTDDAASDYTRALLKAKKRAKKDPNAPQ